MPRRARHRVPAPAPAPEPASRWTRGPRPVVGRQVTVHARRPGKPGRSAGVAPRATASSSGVEDPAAIDGDRLAARLSTVAANRERADMRPSSRRWRTTTRAADPHDHDRDDQDEPAEPEPEPEDQPGPEPAHRPGLADQRAALATARLILTGASPDVVHAAAASGTCPSARPWPGSRSGSRSPPRWPGRSSACPRSWPASCWPPSMRPRPSCGVCPTDRGRV